MFHTKVVEKNNTHILFSITSFSPKIVPFIMWNIAEQGRPQITI
jgi:hypothetical protein